MNKVVGATIVLALSSAMYTPQTQASDVGLAICGYVASDHKSRLRDQLRTNKLKLKKIYKNMRCNDKSLLRFAMLNGADTTGAYIAKRLSASMLSKAEDDGKTILEWAGANGKDGSATVAAIKKRMKI